MLKKCFVRFAFFKFSIRHKDIYIYIYMYISLTSQGPAFASHSLAELLRLLLRSAPKQLGKPLNAKKKRNLALD